MNMKIKALARYDATAAAIAYLHSLQLGMANFIFILARRQ